MAYECPKCEGTGATNQLGTAPAPRYHGAPGWICKLCQGSGSLSFKPKMCSICGGEGFTNQEGTAPPPKIHGAPGYTCVNCGGLGYFL